MPTTSSGFVADCDRACLASDYKRMLECGMSEDVASLTGIRSSLAVSVVGKGGHGDPPANALDVLAGAYLLSGVENMPSIITIDCIRGVRSTSTPPIV